MSEQVIDLDRADSKMLETLRGRGVNTDACYQCLRCSAGCPVLSFMDIHPNKIVRMLQFGMDREVLDCHAIWLCASCQTCTTRCPNDVDIAHMMDILRQEAIARGIACPEPGVEKFHRAFLAAVKRGRVHELSMLIHFKLTTRRFTDDMALGMAMFKRGRIKLLPSRLMASEKMKKIFGKAKESE
jgi:heterodisulfide reductase subunit C2